MRFFGKCFWTILAILAISFRSIFTFFLVGFNVWYRDMAEIPDALKEIWHGD